MRRVFHSHIKLVCRVLRDPCSRAPDTDLSAVAWSVDQTAPAAAQVLHSVYEQLGGPNATSALFQAVSSHLYSIVCVMRNPHSIRVLEGLGHVAFAAYETINPSSLVLSNEELSQALMEDVSTEVDLFPSFS